MLNQLSHFLSRLLVAALLLAALLLGSARLLVPLLADYKNDVAALAAQAIGRTVTIYRMHATWRGLSPVLKLVGVRVTSREYPEQRLEIGQIWVRIDLAAYLLEREVRFSGVDIIDTDFTLVRDVDGRVYVEELPTDPQAAPVDFTAMSRLSIHAAGITFRDLQNPDRARHYSGVSLVLRNQGDRHMLSGHAHLPDDFGRSVEIEARLQGTAPHPLDWQGRIYVRGQDLQLAGLLAQLRPDTQPVTGVADIRVWAEIDAGRLVSVSSELDVSGFSVQSERAASGGLSADQLRTQLGWQRRTHGWQAVLQRFRMTGEGQVWNIANLSVAALTREQNTYLHALASRLPLEAMRGLLVVLPLDTALRKQLLELQATGVLEDVDVSLRQLPETTVLDRFSAHFHELGVTQTGAIPSLAGLSGRVEGSPQSGLLVLDSTSSSYSDTRLFRAPLRFDHLQGELHWQGDAEQLVLSSAALHLDNDHLALDSQFRLEWPHGKGAPQLNLQVAIPRAAVNHVHHYLPAHIMAPTGVSWLDRSLVAGQVHDGSVVIEGRLDQLPFDHGEGKLEVRLPVTDATLDFEEHWSPVEDLDAQVDFTGRKMDIRSRKGRIRSATLQDVHAQISDLVHPHLSISGDVSGALPVMMEELGSSPLGDTYGGFVDRVSTSGPTGLHLDIQVPLEKDHLPVSVAGRISLQGNGLVLRDGGIALSAIKGRLDFNDTGILGDGLTARLFDRPVRARVWTEPRQGHTAVELIGPLDLVDRMLPKDDPLRAAFHGGSEWQVLVTMRGIPARGQRANVGVEVWTRLEGTAIDLPAPLGKPAGSQRELSFRIDDINQREPELLVNYEAALNGLLLLEEGAQGTRLQRGTITLGAKPAGLPDRNVLLLNGELQHLRLEDWEPHLGAGGATTEIPVQVSLRVGELELLGHRIRDTDLDIHADGRVWVIKAAGQQLDGEILLARSASGLDSVSMNLRRLQLERVPEVAPKPATSLRPGDFPDLQVDTKKFVYDGVDFGSLLLSAEKLSDGRLDIRQLVLDSGMLKLRMSGEWYVQDNRARSRMDLSVTGGQLGNLLAALGYEKIIKDGAMTGSLVASWPGAPWEGKPEIMDGKLSLLIKNGQLLDVEPGATGRALGLLSFSKLPRRLLMLDFTDLFGKGFGFSRIAGDFVLDSGNAWVDNLVVDGPAAKIDISGRTGLKAQDYDEVVTVTPYLNSSLPLAGALAGGPAVGAAMLLAEQLLEGKFGLNEMARKQYTVTGPWAEPVITPLKVEAPEQDPYQEMFE